MKGFIQDLNKAFESRIRLGIMSALMVNDKVDFSTLKELLETTDGNLASHTRALENLEYIKVEKSFVGRKPNTRFSITREGRTAFEQHLAALERMLKGL
ncbi:MAG TPA: transcriptional regulator [Flavilitoribacter sp.]|nr:transcriptional regulator [Flavilitoribacter sp.]HMQ86468.1 transcriptional regulator [Flavilitoribacter sp.]